jgi:hypothetical protein
MKTLFDAHFTSLTRTHNSLQRILLFVIRLSAFENKYCEFRHLILA